ncbi:adenine methyltransferase [Polaromonas sp.]|uniref:adenine methyltransferase n=1 Tax=Polaromonas sp. TaxID=1869339 RepID=UPI00286AA7C6|nr:adenine methyltransferase [Polaromonas sp.]
MDLNQRSPNSIRGGGNRKVLETIAHSSRIYEAWSDESWVNEGAAVRVSLVCFGHRSDARLDGALVPGIHADLTPESENSDSIDLTLARVLTENAGFVFEGLRKDGDLDVDGQTARRWMRAPNPHGRSNAEILRPLINGIDITRRRRDGWVIDFGASMSAQDAALYEQPFAHVLQFVKPVREKNNDRIRRTFWWRFGRNGEQFRAAIQKVPRYINTPRVAKHRLFVWQPAANLPDTATVAITISDDTTFGILHSRFHELWSLRMCTWLGVGNDPRYTPTTCFETFPFPAGLSPADTAHQQTETLPGGEVIPANMPTSPVRTAAEKIARAAKRLNDLRENWLNPPEWTQRVPEVIPLGMSTSPYPDRIVPKNGFEKDLAERTLTKLYNQRPAWLAAAHHDLDAAVASAYGWADYSADLPDEEILKRLLALNLARAGTE